MVNPGSPAPWRKRHVERDIPLGINAYQELLQELPLAKGDGSYAKLLARLAKTDVLVLDDWGLVKLNAEQRRDLLEILEDRHGSRATIITSQLPLDQWHGIIGDATLR